MKVTLSILLLLLSSNLFFTVQANTGQPGADHNDTDHNGMDQQDTYQQDMDQAETQQTPQASVAEEEKWWQLRKDRSDIYYPHKPHMEIMDSNGDACMLCHPFAKTDIHDENILGQLNQISNEPLETICHDCHVDKSSAPSQCVLCHPDPSSIWPRDHNFDYKHRHAEDAQADQDSCGECHKQLSFCTDCHFRRNFSGANVHRLGFRNRHGLEARMSAVECGSCHQADYCSDCHRRSR